MKKRVALLAFALAASVGTPSVAQDRPAAPGAQLDPARLALAQEVVDLAFPPARRQEMYARILDAMLSQARVAALTMMGDNLDAEEQQILDRYIARMGAEANRIVTQNSPALFAAFARGYARMFTRDELLEIRAFVATPTGAKYVFRSADLLSDPDVAEANTAYMRTYLAAIQPLETDLHQELLAYLSRREAHSEHPPAASHH